MGRGKVGDRVEDEQDQNRPGRPDDEPLTEWPGTDHARPGSNAAVAEWVIRRPVRRRRRSARNALAPVPSEPSSSCLPLSR